MATVLLSLYSVLKIYKSLVIARLSKFYKLDNSVVQFEENQDYDCHIEGV